MKELISIVVPCYNEEEVIEKYYDATIPVLEGLNVNYEIIFVDDGSKDNTAKLMKQLAEKNKHIKFIILSRNFGKEGAMYAGLCHAQGDYVGLMDVDLQDPPNLIPEMLETLRNEEYECVGTRRVTRKGEPKIRSFFARRFYKLINKMTKTEIVDGARDFRLMKRCMVDSILSMNEYNRFSKGIFSWVGYRTKWLEYENIERAAGETKWSFWKLFKYSLEGIIAFTTAPLAIASIMGILFCFLAFIGVIIIIVRALIDSGSAVAGWPSLVCVILLVGGIQLLTIGILGQYLSKTYLETKKRPIYLTRETNTKEYNKE
jgi:glycosyltransferase involved in cell wall biosynthesis